MNILLLIPETIKTQDPVCDAIRVQFEAAGHKVDVASADTRAEYDIVIPFESMMEKFIEERVSYAGRPWVCAAVYRGKDLIRCIDRFGPNPLDWGIRAMLISSSHYVSSLPALTNAVFSWRPEHSDGWERGNSFDSRPYLFGSYVDKVDDQDFCLAAKLAKKYPDKYVLYVSSAEERSALPLAVQSVAKVIDVKNPYAQFSFYISTPRLTDYRCGILPYEILQSIMNGCWPLLISHPALKPLENTIGCYASLNSFENMLEAAEQLRAAGGRCMSKEDCEAFMLTPLEFVRRVLIAYSRRVSDDAK